MYVAFDPGKRTGIARFNDDGSDINRGVLTEKHFLSYLQLLMRAQTLGEHTGGLVVPEDRPRAFIVEDFKLREDKAYDLVGQESHADRAIGAIELCAHALHVPIYFQGSFILKTALKWARIKPVRGHLPDELSAYAHGVHWLIVNDIRRNPVLDED